MSSIFAMRDYRHLFGAQIVALFGTGLATVALGLLAFELAGPRAAAVLGTALALKMVTYVVVAPVAAAFADRLPRRSMLVGLDVVRAAVVIVLPFVEHVWQVYVLIVILQSASAAFTPAFQAVLPDLLPDREQYTRALSYSQLAATMETLLSPLCAAVVMALVSFHWLFVATSVGFVCSAALVMTSRIPGATAPEGDAHVFDKTVAGLRIFAATPRLRGLVGMDLVVAAVGSVVIVNTVNYVRETLGRSDTDVAVLLACNGFGVMLAALSVPALLRRVHERRVMLSGCVVLVCAVIAAVVLSWAASAAWCWTAAAAIWAVIGVGTGLVLTPTGRVLARSSSSTDRPAVFAAHFSLSHACWLIAYPVAGWGATMLGYTPTWMLLTALAAAGAWVARSSWPRRDPEVLDHVHVGPGVGEHVTHAVPLGDGRWRHAHPFVIDRERDRWPDLARST
uniref:MFS transporter n=1 Tax=Gordonia sp. B7-2 TaxID=3420932 RepID=UPI003D8ED070